jgi:hypothetical protein
MVICGQGIGMNGKLTHTIAIAALAATLAGCGGGEAEEPAGTTVAEPQRGPAQPATPAEGGRAIRAGEGQGGGGAGDAEEQAALSQAPEEQVAACEQRPGNEAINCPTVAGVEADRRAAVDQREEQRAIERCLKRAENDREHLACLPPDQGGPGSGGAQLTTDQQRCQDKAKSTKQSHACLE